jgi:hypothetical protein
LDNAPEAAADVLAEIQRGYQSDLSTDVAGSISKSDNVAQMEEAIRKCHEVVEHSLPTVPEHRCGDEDDRHDSLEAALDSLTAELDTLTDIEGRFQELLESLGSERSQCAAAKSQLEKSIEEAQGRVSTERKLSDTTSELLVELTHYPGDAFVTESPALREALSRLQAKTGGPANPSGHQTLLGILENVRKKCDLLRDFGTVYDIRE